MRRDAVDVDLRQCGDAFENFDRFIFDRAHSAHAGVDFEIDRRFTDSIERLRFIESGNRRNKAALDDGRNFLPERRTEDDDRKMELLAQRDCFFQIGDAKKLDVIGQCFGNAHQTVAVSIRFHDREHFSFANSLAHDFRVVTKRAAIDLSPATIILCHFFGIVICGSRKYIGSSGGCAKFRFAFVAISASIFAAG